MFNNDLTRTYSNQDATLEILLMLFGAFVLGFIFSWLLNKSFKKQDNNLPSSDSKQVKTLPESSYVARTQSSSIRPSETAYTKPKFDDLTKITGIDSEIQGLLKEHGVNSFTDLRDIKRFDLKKIKDTQLSTPISKRKIIETWPHQANLAAKGEWKKLREYQRFISNSYNEEDTTETSNTTKDDLKLIEGIGPTIEKILNENNISTFNALSNIDSITLKNIIVDADKRFAKNETESWPHQAAMAEKGQWEELNIYQEFMHSDTESVALIDTKKEENEIDQQTKFDTSSKESSIESDQDDLKKIEGIGPKIEEVLNKSGIYTFSQLQNSSRERLKSLLNEAGSQFKMHDPQSWPLQASMAFKQDWDKLEEYQESMNSNLKSKPAKNTQQVDDLKKIEGIGPKLQELLNDTGIFTFKDLSKASVEKIQKKLDESGPQYRVHEPDTWPEQATLAANEEWDKLNELQKTIINNKKKS